MYVKLKKQKKLIDLLHTGTVVQVATSVGNQWIADNEAVECDREGNVPLQAVLKKKKNLNKE